MSVRVPVMTIGSDSGAGVGDDSWPSQIDLARNEIKKNSERFFCTSNPPVSRGELAAEPFAPLSFFFLRRSFFAVRAGLADSGIGLQRGGPKKLKSGSASRWRMRRIGSNILAPGLRPEGFSDSPFSRLHRCSEHGHSACALGAQTTSLCSIAKRLACGKSYPVTAAQLLRLHTGFLAPIHCFKLAKN